MKKRRKKGLILSQNKRQLIIYSTIINMPYYYKLKKLLTSYDKIYVTDFEDLEEFDDELQKLFKYAIDEVTASAEREWYTKGFCDPVEGWPRNYERCQLCNTKNRYIFYIENKETKQVLNVGSDCIIEFPTLNTIDGININTLKNIRIRESAKVSRILKFNEHFPDTQNLIKDLESEYDNVPIVLPHNLYFQVPDILKKMRNLYSDYVNNKIQYEPFTEFQNLITEYNKSKCLINQFVQYNKNNELICKKEIKDWLFINGKENIIEDISKNNGMYDSNTIQFITKCDFLNENIDKIKKSINTSEISLIEISNDKLYFNYTNPNYNNSLKFYISNILFMNLFGTNCFITKNNINLNILFTHLKVVWNDTNIDTILSRLEKIIKPLGYSISYNSELRKLKYKNISLDRYKDISLTMFIDSNTYLLFLNDIELKSKYIKIFDKIHWQKIEEESKYKFNTSDISQNPYN